jgi:hypothetical protein
MRQHLKEQDDEKELQRAFQLVCRSGPASCDAGPDGDAVTIGPSIT